LAGIIPFSIIFLNWHELLGSVVKGELYLSIESTVYSSTLMLVVSAQITVVLVFLQLCAEDYLWWWQSFILGASSSLYMFIYGAFYYMQKSAIEGVVGGTIFLSHLFMACALVGLCTGTLSFISTYIIIRRIYSSVKVRIV
jgi:transmembrane 9 superfamily protein 2/4